MSGHSGWGLLFIVACIVLLVAMARAAANENKTDNDSLAARAQQTLVWLGYEPKQAKLMVGNALRQYHGQNEGELVRLAIRLWK